MTEPVVSDELTQGVRDAQAKFDQGMGAAGDASPYPMLAELGHRAAVHRGWPEMGVPAALRARSRSSPSTPSTR